MQKRRILVAALTVGLATAPLSAAPPVEKLHYSWSLKGALSWLARIAFPTSGVGTLETRSGSSVQSRLQITSPDQRGFAFYESRMSPDGSRTFTSADGFTWSDRGQENRVVFDYANGVARVERHTEDGVKKKVRQLRGSVPQDVLTSIFYLRQNANEITSPRQAQVYSGGKPYTFMFTPRPVTMLRVGNESFRVRPFSISPTSEDKKGTVRVWLTDDARHLPVSIEIEQNYATLKLSLKR